MLSILGKPVGASLTRREVLRVGGLGFTGLMWSDWLRARASAAAPSASSARVRTSQFGKAKSCILVFNYGGPSHLDTFDLKPDAPREIRGEFQPIATRTPGLLISEHLPRLARASSVYTVVRSVSHIDNDHAVGTYLSLTGYGHPRARPLGVEPPATPQDMPSLGSVVSKLRPAGSVFSYVTLGDLRHLGNNDSMGQNAGCLGRAYDPFTVPFVRPTTNPSLEGALDMRGVTSVMADVDNRQLQGRHRLLAEMAQAAPPLDVTPGMRNLDGFTRRAFELLSSPAGRAAFNLHGEPQPIRDAYGPTPFGQNCLLARRLVEAGVPLITLYSVGNRDWDTHGKNFQLLRDTLLPPMDQGLAALLEDLRQRGLLDETLVVWMGDMGRTPRINGDAGRDHWSFCYSILMAGAGVHGGRVYGSSDRGAAYPSTSPVHPADVAATIYHCLGIDPRAHVADQQGRPLVVSAGSPVHALLG
jgi:hypothetical protein